MDRRGSLVFRVWRKFLSGSIDAFLTNSRAGQRYLMEVLGVPERRVFVHPYEVPDSRLWEKQDNLVKIAKNGITFVYVG